MFGEDIPEVFVSHASDILASGLSGSQIIKITAAYAVELNVDLPHPTYPFSKIGTNKRTALFQNLMAFSGKKQYRIIKEMCENPSIAPKGEAAELKIKLLRYSHLDEEQGEEGVNKTLVDQTRHWLEGFPDSLLLFNSALQKQEHRLFLRNLLDDLRLSLEKLLQDLLGNGKTLENQFIVLGPFLKAKGGSPELSNMFQKLLDYYCKYQNTYVKHDDSVIEEEIEFIFEITASFMKHLVRLNARGSR